MDQREFLDIIRAYCRRLNLAGFLEKLVFALSIGAVVGVIFQILAFVMPLYYVNVYTGIALLSAAAAAAFVSFARRSTMEHAALVMDSFGFQERIITAYERLKENNPLSVIQRRDAMEQLRRNRDRIRIPLWPNRRKTGVFVLLLTVMVVLSLLPSGMKDTARELHRIRQEAREKEKEITDVLEELAKLEESAQDTLTPEQMAALQEMMESLKSSLTEYQQADSAEALQAAGDKLNYKYADMGSRMAELAKSMQNGATVSTMPAEEAKAMAEKLQRMGGNPSADGSLASNQGQNGNSQNGNDQSGQGSNQNGNGQDGQDSGQNGQGNSQNGSGQSGQGNDQGGNGQNGQGNGQSGDGQDGQGSSQNGQDGGSGSGRGTGSANTPHDYVSIPNDVADSENLTGNSVDHDNSEYFRAQNGLSWEGTHMSHEAVIGSYEQNAYEGIAAGRYPSGMENVIKEYFSSFN